MTVVSNSTALLSGSYWYPGSNLKALPTVVSYSFLKASPGYGVGPSSNVDPATFRSMDANDQAVVREALGKWSAVSGLTFIETQAIGDITFGFYDLESGTAGTAFFPSSGGYVSTEGSNEVYGGTFFVGGDVKIDIAYDTNPVRSDMLHVVLHEIGHALGLKHPHEGDPTLSPLLDTGTHTVMSYDQNVRARVLGDLDVQAIQAIYGTRAAGDGAVKNWSWDAGAQTFTITGSAQAEFLRGLGGATDVVRGVGTGDAVVTQAGDDVIYASGPAFSINAQDGRDVVVVGNAKPFRVQGAASESYVGTGGSNFQEFLNVEYIQFDNGIWSTAAQRYLSDAASNTALGGYVNLLRMGDVPSVRQTVADLAARIDSGQVSHAQGLAQVFALTDQTTSVATLSYQFFTGKIPTLAGLDYLISPTGPNPNNLNSAYYQSFNLENRYINFAVNLGKLGEGKDAFAASYGSMSLFDATKSAYGRIFGAAPSDEKVHALLDPVFNFNGQTISRADYFGLYGQDGQTGVGTKAAMVGWLLAEAEKADIGLYAKADAAFLTDFLDGATLGVDLVGVYGRPEFNHGG